MRKIFDLIRHLSNNIWCNPKASEERPCTTNTMLLLAEIVKLIARMFEGESSAVMMYIADLGRLFDRLEAYLSCYDQVLMDGGYLSLI